MNFVGHVAVAIGHRHTSGGGHHGDGYLLGAALPDLAAMGRFRLLGRPVDGSVARGVDLHHRTDEVFHRHPWFRACTSTVTRRLEAVGLPRGAARACGHVGVELLLDGHLLAADPGLGPSVQRTIAEADRRVDDLEPLVAEPQRPGWRHHLGRLAGWPVPDDYDEPAAVAARLQRILARRPRLAFDRDGVALVARVLDEQRAAVADGAAALLDDLLDDLERDAPAR